jgi:hypothetical protein
VPARPAPATIAPFGPILRALGPDRGDVTTGYDGRSKDHPTARGSAMTEPSTSERSTERRPPSSDSGRTGTIVFGLIVLALGLWFFAERTLGIDLPRIAWGSLWPVALIGIGAWVLLGGIRRAR